MPELKIPNCRRCDTKLEPVRDKEYYGCPKWMKDGKGCEGDIWSPEKKIYPIVSFSHKVESKSNPGHFYIVKVYESGDMDCPCFAGQMNRFCRHKKIMFNNMLLVLKKIQEKSIHNQSKKINYEKPNL